MSKISQQKKEVSGIILAAGMGSRMNRIKQLLLYSEKPLLQYAVDAASSSALSQVILVLGFEGEAIKRLIDPKGAEIVQNKFFAEGQGSSLKTGLAAVSIQHHAALFLLGDQPLINSRIIDRIVGQYQKTGSAILIPVYQGKRGNPVLVDRSLFEDLQKLSGDAGGRELFEKHADKIEFLEMESDAILTDIDTPEDYEKLLKRGRYA